MDVKSIHCYLITRATKGGEILRFCDGFLPRYKNVGAEICPVPWSSIVVLWGRIIYPTVFLDNLGLNL
jgi:hypothetical protein